MRDDQGVLRGVSWRDACPWLVIFRTYRLSVRPSLLILATCGTLLAPLGWRVAEFLFVDDAIRQDSEFAAFVAHQRRFTATPSPVREWGRSATSPDAARQNPPDAKQLTLSIATQSALPRAYREMVAPFQWLASRESLRVKQYAYLIAGTVWSLLVWGLLGGAITRTTLLELGREESSDWTQSLRCAWGRLRSLVLAPWMPVGAIALLTIPCLLLGLVMRADMGVFVGGVCWILVAVAGFLIALLLVGLACGWPLMYSAVTGESGGDEFEALHRSFSYVYGRPLHYAFYVLVAAVLGIVGSVVADAFAQLTIWAGDWAVSWGTGNSRWAEIEAATAGKSSSGTLKAGVALMGTVEFLVWQAAAGFRYAFFWCAAAAVYLLMRQQVDDTEFNELDTEDDVAALNLLSASGDPNGPGEGAANEDGGDSSPGAATNLDA